MKVIMSCSGTAQSTIVRVECTWKHLAVRVAILGEPVTSMAVLRSAGNMPVSTDYKPQSSGDNRWNTSNHIFAV
jgi:hypothetical protein